jgi:hypothetical protein
MIFIAIRALCRIISPEWLVKVNKKTRLCFLICVNNYIVHSIHDHLFFLIPNLAIYKSMASTLDLKIEFGGGLDLLFGKKQSHRITIPALVPSSNATADMETKKAANITFLIRWLKENLLKERPELFEENGTVCVSL